MRDFQYFMCGYLLGIVGSGYVFPFMYYSVGGFLWRNLYYIIGIVLVLGLIGYLVDKYFPFWGRRLENMVYG